jgi:hypothetical protein
MTSPRYLAYMSRLQMSSNSFCSSDSCGAGSAEAQETYTYNNRLQQVMIEVGTTGNATADCCWVHNYALGAANPSSCQAPSVAAGNNGNVTGSARPPTVAPPTSGVSNTVIVRRGT